MRIFLITSNDNPHPRDKTAQNLSLGAARFLAEKNIEIELFPLPPSKFKSFNVHLFFSSIVSFDLEEVNDAIIDTTNKILDL